MFAQDVIVKKDGSTIVCRVVELTSSEIVYKKWSNLNGSNYVMNRADASAINYENGKKMNLSKAINLYTPNNQNDGVQQFNDKALLRMDDAASKPLKKAKMLRIIGIAGGIGLEVAGILLVKGSKDELYGDSGPDNDEAMEYAGYACIVGGIVGATTCLWCAHNITKKYKVLNTSLWYKEFKLKNGTLLSPSVDYIRDQAYNYQTIGLGLRYNF